MLKYSKFFAIYLMFMSFFVVRFHGQATVTATGEVSADAFYFSAGPDLGAEDRAAVTFCQTVLQATACNIVHSKGGTWSTSPDLPIGYNLIINPAVLPANYTAATTLYFRHSGTGIYGSGVAINCTMSSGNCIYVGKGISSVVDCSVVAGNTTCIYDSGDDFLDLDPGDQAEIRTTPGHVPACNITAVNVSTMPHWFTCNNASITVTSGSVVFSMNNASGGNHFPPHIHDLNLNGSSSLTIPASGLALDLADEVRIFNYTAANFMDGDCIDFYGALDTDVYSLTCSAVLVGIHSLPNKLGSFVVTGTNDLRVFGFSVDACPSSSSAHAFWGQGAGPTLLQPSHVEGCLADQVYRLEDYPYPDMSGSLPSGGLHDIPDDHERNGNGNPGSAEYYFTGYTDHVIIDGSSGFSAVPIGSTPSLEYGVYADTNTSDIVLRDVFIGRYSYAYNFLGGCGTVDNIITTLPTVGSVCGAWNHPTETVGCDSVPTPPPPTGTVDFAVSQVGTTAKTHFTVTLTTLGGCDTTYPVTVTAPYMTVGTSSVNQVLSCINNNTSISGVAYINGGTNVFHVVGTSGAGSLVTVAGQSASCSGIIETQ